MSWIISSVFYCIKWLFAIVFYNYTVKILTRESYCNYNKIKVERDENMGCDEDKNLTAALENSDIPGLKLINKGKVRDIYDLGNKLLIITTDRISAFDVVLEPGVSDKGRALTQLSLFWFEYLQDIIPNHLLSDSVEELNISEKLRKVLRGRSMLVKKAKPVAAECIVRGYLVGSGWKEYQESGTVCGIRLPAGLEQAAQLPEPIFTPSTKAEIGDHDENISFARMEEILGKDVAAQVRDASISLYKKAADFAREKGIIIADTKFEFGIYEDKVILIDEVLTPDSSRFWPAETYRTGENPPSFDKQFVRDWLENTGWDKTPPAPMLPEEIILKTRQKYIDAFESISGRKWEY